MKTGYEKKNKNWLAIIFGVAIVGYALFNLVIPPLIENASPRFHVWNLELRGTPAIVVGLSFLAGGILSVLAGWRTSSNP